jgi:glycine cleavage system regulatory protein
MGIQPAQKLNFGGGNRLQSDLKVEVLRVDVGPFRANPAGILFRVPAITMPGITEALARFAPGQAIAFHQ